MIQTAVTYAIVIAATGWIVWRVLLPAALRTRLRARAAGPKSPAGGCGDDCGCT